MLTISPRTLEENSNESVAPLNYREKYHFKNYTAHESMKMTSEDGMENN